MYQKSSYSRRVIEKRNRRLRRLEKILIIRIFHLVMIIITTMSMTTWKLQKVI